MKSILISMLVLLGLPLSAQAKGVSENLFGGRQVNNKTFYVSAGFPDIELGVKLPVGPIELTPRLQFSYFYASRVGWLDLAPALDLRANVFTTGSVTGAIVGSVPVHLSWPGWGTGFTAGVGILWPGFMGTWAIRDFLDFNFGVQFQDDLFFPKGGGVQFAGKVPFTAGVEYAINDRMQIAGRVEMGPGFSTGGLGGYGGLGLDYGLIGAGTRAGNVWFHGRFVFGFGYSF